MHVQRLDHVNIRTHDLDATRDFYVDVIGLQVGARPPFAVPGLWLYDETAAVIHVIGLDPDEPPVHGSGTIDHVAFRVVGVNAMRERIRRARVAAEEAVVPRTGDVQIFVRDPNGVKIELNFSAADLALEAELAAH
jgi:catechol 2,3-dioxygenase-like lactoylglutathione lyase family enzyme